MAGRSSYKAQLKDSKSHSLVQGEILNAANLLHSEFFLTFLIATGFGRTNRTGDYFPWYNHARTLWHLSQSDKFQREMAVLAVTTVPFPLFAGFSVGDLFDLRGRFTWAQKQADGLAAARNLVAHSPITFQVVIHVPGASGKRAVSKLVPRFGGTTTKPEHWRRLERMPGLTLWRGLRDDILRMKDYLYGLNQFLMSPVPVHTLPKGAASPLPRKPRLSSLKRFRAIEAQIARETQQERQSSQQRPSRAKSRKKPSRPRRSPSAAGA